MSVALAAQGPVLSGQDNRRWGGAFAAVLGLHAVALVAVAQMRGEPHLPPEEIPIAVELAPLSIAHKAGEPSPAPAAAAAAAAAAAQPEQRPEPVRPQPHVRPDVPLPSAPVPLPVRPAVPAPSPAAPAHAATGASAGSASATSGSATGQGQLAEGPADANARGQGRGGGDAAALWRGRVLAHLERHKRYPAAARLMKREGSVRISLMMDRHGRVLSISVDRPTGFKPLDVEAEEVVRRSAPLPPPPPEVPGQSIAMQLPIGFGLSGAR
ncbi:MAG: TonB family protein [Sphingobium sp.]